MDRRVVCSWGGTCVAAGCFGSDAFARTCGGGSSGSNVDAGVVAEADCNAWCNDSLSESVAAFVLVAVVASHSIGRPVESKTVAAGGSVIRQC